MQYSDSVLLFHVMSHLDLKIRSVIPGSIFDLNSKIAWFTNEAGIDVEGAGVILGCAVELFRANTHILYIDACHTSDDWVIMTANFIDSNHHIQLVGFRLCPVEDETNWICFAHALKKGGIDESVGDLVIMSDRSPAITRTIILQFKWAEHAHCLVHVERNCQQQWDELYSGFDSGDVGVKTFNLMMNELHEATIAVEEDECLEIL